MLQPRSCKRLYPSWLSSTGVLAASILQSHDWKTEGRVGRRMRKGSSCGLIGCLKCASAEFNLLLTLADFCSVLDCEDNTDFFIPANETSKFSNLSVLKLQGKLSSFRPVGALSGLMQLSLVFPDLFERISVPLIDTSGLKRLSRLELRSLRDDTIQVSKRCLRI